MDLGAGVRKVTLGAFAVSSIFGGSAASAQQVTGTLGSPSATTTINGKQLPPPPPKFGGVIKESAKNSKPYWPPTVVPPKGAPNILLIMTDDAGYGVSSTFGGVIPTPAMDRVAQAGLRYTQFHTTALCSPTRAALITGRNHHSAGFGVIGEMSTGFPGYDSIIPEDKATIGEVFKGNGYATSWFGKNHNTPSYQYSLAGPFDQWPSGMGFDYFYGFMGGETDQWTPYLWGLFYLWRGCMPDAETALYFSGVTYTTIGYGEVVLAKPWRLLGPIEGLMGVLMCGLSTGYFFVVLSRVYQSRLGILTAASPSEG
jgi:Sulfatase/Ion channel